MSSVLKSKLDSARQSGETDSGAEAITGQVEPLQNVLCESLKLITQQDYDLAAVSMTPLFESDIQSTIETSGLKLSLRGHDGAPQYFGILSPALVTEVCQHSLLFAQDGAASEKKFNPSKLDCLLMLPMAQRIGESLSAVAGLAASLTTQVGLSFAELAINKPDFKAAGDCVKLKLCIQPLITAASEDGQAPTGETLFIELILPRALINNMMRASPTSKETSAPVLDPAHPWAVHMRQAVNAANVPVRAVVESCAMTVAECTRLEIGQVIALPGVTLDAVQLFIDMETGPEAKPLPVSLAQGSLGIFKKNRALKMNEEIDPGFIKDMNLHII